MGPRSRSIDKAFKRQNGLPGNRSDEEDFTRRGKMICVAIGAISMAFGAAFMLGGLLGLSTPTS